ncbi:MAG: hypothetical protein ACLU80_10165 [Dorea sp.]
MKDFTRQAKEVLRDCSKGACEGDGTSLCGDKNICFLDSEKSVYRLLQAQVLAANRVEEERYTESDVELISPGTEMPGRREHQSTVRDWNIFWIMTVGSSADQFRSEKRWNRTYADWHLSRDVDCVAAKITG